MKGKRKGRSAKGAPRLTDAQLDALREAGRIRDLGYRGGALHYPEASTTTAALERNSRALAEDVDAKALRDYLSYSGRRGEHNVQKGVVDWARKELEEGRRPELELLYACPNSGGYAGTYKDNFVRYRYAEEEGLNPGVPDLCLPVPRGGYHGLYIETKRPATRNPIDGKVSAKGAVKPDQQRKISLLRGQGYYVEVYYWPEDGIRILRDYLDGKILRP
jgi:hypothetical protein